MKSKRPKILMIAPLPPPVHGSAMMTQYIKDSKTVNDRCKLDWINLSTSRTMSEIGKRSPVKLVRFAGSFFKTFGKLLTHRYDKAYIAITCHGGGFLKDAPFALLCKLFGLHLIIHQHNKGMSKDVDKPLFRTLLRMVYKNSTVVLLSWRLYPDIEKIVEKRQVIICPNGIPDAPRFPHKENKVPRILFLSNLLIDKGVLVLLDACKILKEKGYVFTCDFIGGETKEIDAQRFEKEVKKRGLDKKIFYLGPKYGEDKRNALAESDVFAMPTKYANECFPLVLLEAMQQGVPAVSSAEGGIPDIIEENKTGFISLGADAEELANKISILLEDDAIRERMGEASINRFEELFSIKKFEEAISEVLTNVKWGGVIPVRYLGKMYGDEKLRKIATSDIFALPTMYINETFGLVYVEAMQQGVCVVGTDEGGIPDVIEKGKTGMIVSKGMSLPLANALQKLIDNPDLRASLAESGYQKYMSDYRLSIFEERVTEILENEL